MDCAITEAFRQIIREEIERHFGGSKEVEPSEFKIPEWAKGFSSAALRQGVAAALCAVSPDMLRDGKLTRSKRAGRTSRFAQNLERFKEEILWLGQTKLLTHGTLRKKCVASAALRMRKVEPASAVMFWQLVAEPANQYGTQPANLRTYLATVDHESNERTVHHNCILAWNSWRQNSEFYPSSNHSWLMIDPI